MDKRFKFKDTTAKYSIYDKDDNLIKEYIIDVGSEDFITKVENKRKELEKVTTDSETGIEEAKKIMRELINMIFKNDFDIIYEACNKNIFWMGKFLEDVSNWIADNYEEMQK